MEAHLTDRTRESLTAIQEAVRLWRALGDRAARGHEPHPARPRCSGVPATRRAGGRPRAPPSASWRASSRARSWPWPTGCWRACPTCPTPTSRGGRGVSAPRRSRGSSATTRALAFALIQVGVATVEDDLEAGAAMLLAAAPARRPRGPRRRRRTGPHVPRAAWVYRFRQDQAEPALARRAGVRRRARGGVLPALPARDARPEPARPRPVGGRRAGRPRGAAGGGAVGDLHHPGADHRRSCCRPAAAHEDAGATLEEAWRWAVRAGGVQRISRDGGRPHRARLAQRRPRGGAGVGRRRLPAGRRDRGAVVHR